MATDSTTLDELQGDDADSQPADSLETASQRISASDLSGIAVADDSEAAAIVAAIAAHIRDRQAAAAAAAAKAEAEADGESRRSWAFAGRLEAIGEASNRPPESTPQDAWSAASRADRF